jgi:hypothetical protein
VGPGCRKRPPADVGKRSLRSTEMTASICVSTVSIVCTIDAYSFGTDKDVLIQSGPIIADALTVLTVLTLFSPLVLSLIILVPARPWRENVTSMPSVRRNVCARRSRPASARGFLAYALPVEMSLRANVESCRTRIHSSLLAVHGSNLVV